MGASWPVGPAVLRSLTARMVLAAVLLVVVVAVGIATATTLGVRGYLLDRLEREVQRSAQRAPTDLALYQRGIVPGLTGPGGPTQIRGSGGETSGPRIQDIGSLTAFLAVTGQPDFGWVLTQGSAGQGTSERLDDSALDELSDVPADGSAHRVELDDGSYLVVVNDLPGGTVVSGLPTDDVDDVVAALVRWEAALTLLGAAGALAVGLLVVRRQLRPLREVAATAHDVASLSLDTGEVEGLTDRVPEHLRDQSTEVGQVGAALRTLLAHVESSLRARHLSEQQVRQFVADASHELRTPLATIAGYTELARRRPDDLAAAGTALAKVAEESARMTSLVEDLLLLARLDAGRPLATEPVDLTLLLLEVTEDARMLAPDHRWRLDLPEDSVHVSGDQARLRQVVTNLVTNARKHTPPGTAVTVGVRTDSDRGTTTVTVRDDGPGFPPELAEHAFERFARADTARNRAGGAGLGLSIVEAIVLAHGGSVSLRSGPGRTVVAVELPTERLVSSARIG